MTRRIERAFLIFSAVLTAHAAFHLARFAYFTAIQGAHDVASTFAIGCFCCVLFAADSLKKAWART
jgi:hypothetical protein